MPKEQRFGIAIVRIRGKAGIAIFILGNKLADDDVVIADGVLKEYEIAKQLDLVIVPVGFSGFAAEQIWQETMASFEETFPEDNGEIRALYESLGSATDNPMEMISKVIDTLNALLKE